MARDGYVRADYYNKTELKEQCGFTDKMIADLLPSPIERQNPYYRSSPPMKLWRKSDVERVMATEEYAQAKAEADKRRVHAKKSVATKRAKTAAQVDEAISRIHVDHPSDLSTKSKVLRAGVEHKEELDSWRGKYDEYDTDYRSADTPTKERWAVNYIRHELTEYDQSLFEMKGKVGVREEYQRYRCAVLDVIAREYPFLAAECERQKNPSIQ